MALPYVLMCLCHLTVSYCFTKNYSCTVQSQTILEVELLWPGLVVSREVAWVQNVQEFWKKVVEACQEQWWCTLLLFPLLSKTYCGRLHSSIPFSRHGASNIQDAQKKTYTQRLVNPRPGMGSRITRTGRGGGRICPPANSAPMKARITKFLWEVGWL